MKNKFLTGKSYKNLILASFIMLLSAVLFILSFQGFTGFNRLPEGGGESQGSSFEPRNQSSQLFEGDESQNTSKPIKRQPTPIENSEEDLEGNDKEGRLVIKRESEELPELRIDLEQTQSLPQLGGGQSHGFSIQMGEKPRHEPLIEIEGVTGNPYIRFMAFKSFNGSSWLMGESTELREYMAEEKLRPYRVRVKVFNPVKGFAPVLGHAEDAHFPVANVYQAKDEGLYYLKTEMDQPFELYYNQAVPKLSSLKSANVGLLPQDVTNPEFHWIKNWLDGIAKPEDTAYERIQAIKKFLLGEYQLTDGNELKGYGERHMEAFLLQEKKGSFLDFNSAFVLMLQAVDIPARMAVGYRIDEQKNYQVVYGDQIRVFPEIFLAGYGWIPVELFTKDAFYIPPVETEAEIIAMDNSVKRGETIRVAGVVRAKDGRTVGGNKILLYVKERKGQDCLAHSVSKVEEGKFEFELAIDDKFAARSYQVVVQSLENDRLKASWSDPELKVMDETYIEIENIGDVNAGSPIPLKGGLYEKSTGKLISDMDLEMEISGDYQVMSQEKHQKMVLKSKFETSLELTLREQAKPSINLFFLHAFQKRITFHFKGSTYYLPSSYEKTFSQWEVNKGRIIVFTAGMILLGTIGRGFWLRMRGRKIQAAPIQVSAEGLMDAPAFQPERSDPMNSSLGKELEINILFPQILDPFPLLWGKNDLLMVRFVDETGAYQDVEMIFEKTGFKRIHVYAENRKHKATGTIRIVDYAEEIILHSKEVMKVTGELYGPFLEKHTPREMAVILDKKNLNEISVGFGKIIDAFEKAAYGGYAPGRKEYEDFYRNFLDLTGMLERKIKKNEK